MDLTRPEWMWALVMLPVLWWLARPPSPRRVIATAHLPQWRAALERLRRQPVRFRRLRFWLLVGAYAGVVLASSGPRAHGTDGPRLLAVVIDGSASMHAREPDGRTALAVAAERVTAVLATLAEELDARVLWPGATGLEIRRARPAELAASLAAELATATPSVPTPELDLAAIAARIAGADVAVWTLTDARGSERPPAGGALDVLGGGELRNRALQPFAVIDPWPLPDVRIEVELRSWPALEDYPGVLVRGGGEQQPAVIQPIGPGAWRVRIDLKRGVGGSVTIALPDDPADALALDDMITVTLPASPGTRIGILRGVESSGPSAESWVGRTAARLADLVDGTVVDASPGDRVGLLLVDGGRLGQAPRGAMTFGTEFAPAEARAEPSVLGWDRAHRLTADLDLSELVVHRAVGAAALPNGMSLIDGVDGPLMVGVDGPDGRGIYCGFRLEDSNLPLLAAFPQLLKRAMVWTAGAVARPAISSFPTPLESDLRRAGSTPDRPLPNFGQEGRSLTVPCLLLALLLLAFRMHAR